MDSDEQRILRVTVIEREMLRDWPRLKQCFHLRVDRSVV
jgi:hypothetical protein